MKILKYRFVFYIIFVLFFAFLSVESIIDKSFCPLYKLTGFKCAGCGVTRAFTLFMHLDFKSAFNFNSVFTLSVFPISLFLMIEDTVSLVIKKYKKNHASLIETAFKILQ